LADSSPSAATDIWYDCATEFAPWPLLSGTDCKQSAAEIGRQANDINTQLQDPTAHSAAPSDAQVCATKARRHATKASKASTPRQPKPAQTAQPPSQPPPVTATDHNNGPSEIIIPQILPTDYETDTYLKDIYLYLTQGLLTGSDDQDRATLLLAEDFFVDQNGSLYRISLPRGKKASRVQSTEIRLALPQIYLAEVGEKAHELGHFSKERNLELLLTRFYAKNLYDAVARYQQSCDKCQRMKKDPSHKTNKLHSLRTPNQPNEMWAVDHLILSRPTADGKTAIIVFVDTFSKWPVSMPTKGTSALESTQAFVEGVVSVFGLNPNGKLILNSDKRSAFTSSFFKELCKLLNVRLITSASQVSTSNEMAEATV
jgi:hypothetical protein